MVDSRREPFVDKLIAKKGVVAEHIEHVHMDAGARKEARNEAPRQKPPRNIPPRNDKFVGRTEELDEIHKRLAQTAELGVSQQTAAHGLGGIGKTSVAVEYAWRHLDDYPGGLFVILCDRDMITPAIVELADHLGVEEADTPERTAQRVKDYLEAGEPSLLILDNVRDGRQWSDSEWSKYLPAGNCRRLITTRAAYLPGVGMYRIERLPPDQGIELLARFRPDAAERKNLRLTGAIVDWLDGLAVGLTVVGVYMGMHEDLSWKDYKRSLQEMGLGAVRAAREGIDATGGLPDRYAMRVDAIFDDTVEALSAEKRRALEYAALLPEDTVLRLWLSWLLEHDEDVTLPEMPGYDGRPAEPVVSDLVEMRLLRPVEGIEGTLALHRVLRHRLREHLDKDDDRRNTLLDRIVELADFRGEKSHGAVTDKSRRAELTPLLALSDELLAQDRVVAAVSLTNLIHEPLRALARHVQNRRSLERFVKEGACPTERADAEEASVLISNLALTLQDLGNLGVARAYMERAIKIREEDLEADHPNLANSYSNLAMILGDLGDLPAARAYMERAIKIDEKHLDADHPKVAIKYSNLATILQNVGDLPAAREYIERAIKIDEKHLDADHPSLPIRYSNLAVVLSGLGDLPAARKYMERAIKIGEMHLDGDHPDLAKYYSNLAMILQHLGDLPAARGYIERAVKINEKHFDADNPNLATGYSNLALILQDLGDLRAAREYTERAIKIDEKHFDPEHPNLATYYNNLAHIELTEGNRGRACELWGRAYAILTKHFDGNHPHVRDAMENLRRHCGGVPKNTQ